MKWLMIYFSPFCKLASRKFLSMLRIVNDDESSILMCINGCGRMNAHNVTMWWYVELR